MNTLMKSLNNFFIVFFFCLCCPLDLLLPLQDGHHFHSLAKNIFVDNGVTRKNYQMMNQQIGWIL